MTATWVRTTLGEIAEIVSGATPKTSEGEYWGGDVPWVTPKELSSLEGSTIDSTERTLTAAGLKSCAASLLPPRSVLLSSRAPIGLVAINDVPMATNQGFKSLIPDGDRVDSKFLYWWLRCHRARLEAMGNGATFKEVSKKVVDGVAIDLPPIDEQRRIAVLLDAAEALRAKRRQALAKVDDLIQAVFVDIFGDPLHPDAETVALVDMAEIVMGQSPPGDTYNERGHGVPLLNGPAEFGDEHPIPVQWTTAPTRMSKAGDILFCVRGATAGRLNWSDANYCLGRGLAAIRAEGPRRAFLFHVLDALYSRFQSRGVGSTFINISKSDLQGVRVPAANSHLMLQHERAHSKMTTQRTAMQASLARFDLLFASLQQRAFRGEL